jgi:2-polyprenyl-3-methyl-5-hydroxy-6-metoxy-1,4-benzoquinol methylase
VRRPLFDSSWGADVVDIYRNDMREVWDPHIEPHSFHSYQNQLALYLGLAEKYGARSVLDVGCAQGTLALLLAERGRTVTGVDIRETFLTYARQRYERGEIRFLAANIFDRPPLGLFDLAFGNQIIEHLVYPTEFLRALAQYVRRDGIIVVSTPNHDYFRSSLPSYTELGDPRQHEHRQFSAGGGDHFFAYTEKELRKAAQGAGLAIEEVLYFETPWISGHFLFRFLHGVIPLSWLQRSDRLALRVAPRRLAHQLCLVARRTA